MPEVRDFHASVVSADGKIVTEKVFKEGNVFVYKGQTFIEDKNKDRADLYVFSGTKGEFVHLS
ncbi:MAG: hypothetical protein U5N86_00490 [Planctomycetota bacterium]|nr:hypothetical protein [Planctomycetota bacterium]